MKYAYVLSTTLLVILNKVHFEVTVKVFVSLTFNVQKKKIPWISTIVDIFK